MQSRANGFRAHWRSSCWPPPPAHWQGPRYRIPESLHLVDGSGPVAGKAAAVAAIGLDALFSLARLNPIAILSGIGFAVFLQYAPTIASGILTAIWSQGTLRGQDRLHPEIPGGAGALPVVGLRSGHSVHSGHGDGVVSGAMVVGMVFGELVAWQYGRLQDGSTRSSHCMRSIGGCRAGS